MATVAVSDSNLRRQDMEGSVSGTTTIGSGPGAGTFAEAFYQGVQAWGRKVGVTNNERGFFVTITTVDMTAAGDNVVMLKGLLVNSGVGSTVVNDGTLRHRIGSAVTAAYNYIVADAGDQGDNGEFAYPIRGGWIISPIDPNVTAWRDFTEGSPNLAAVTEVSVGAAVTATTNNENCIFDAIDFGPGLWLVGGDSTDADGTWQDFVDDDEGDATNGRFGHVFTLEGIIYVYGTLVTGETSGSTITATEFTDSLKTLVFPGGRVAAGWNGIKHELGNSSTVVTCVSNTYIGRGRDDKKIWFDSEDEVDGTNEEIDAVAHGFASGDAVLYSDEGGTETIGVTDATEYFVEWVTADAFSLHATRQASLDGSTPIGLTASTAGNGEQHSFRRQPDTRPDFVVSTGTGSGTETGSVFQRFRNITPGSGFDMTGCVFVECKLLTPSQGKLDACIMTSPTTAEGEAFVAAVDPSDITDCTFEIGEDGHAIEATTSGTFGFAGNMFTGYWTHAGEPGDGATFHTTDNVDGVGEDVTTIAAHGFTTGDAVYYNDNGGAVSMGLTDGDRYYVNVISTTNISFHVTKQDSVADTNRVGLTASGAETHALYSSKATIVNNSGGLVTLSVTDGDLPYVRNIGVSTTVVTADVQVTLTNLVNPTEVRVYAAGTTTELAGQENVTTGTFAFTQSQGTDVDIRIFAIQYLPADLIGFTVPASATSLPIQQVFDRNYENP